MPTPDATLVVATRDRPALVERFLVPLAQTARDRGWDVVVADQSRNGHTRALVEALDGVTYLWVEPGLARARNAGSRPAATGLISSCDDAVGVPPEWFDEVVRLFEEHPDAGAVCGPVRSQAGDLLPGAAKHGAAGDHHAFRFYQLPLTAGFAAGFARRRLSRA